MRNARHLDYSSITPRPTGDDYYHVRVLAYSFIAFGGLALIGTVIACVAVPDRPAKWIGLGIGIAGAWMFLAGYLLHRKTGLRFCFCAGVISLFFFPVGTVLGLATFNLLRRPQIRSIFRMADGGEEMGTSP
jgi:hypothetical protein